MVDKLIQLLKDHARIQHELTLYPYQIQIARRIFDALIQNLRLTANASEADVKKLKREEIHEEISRQAGKTTILVLVIEVIMEFFPKLFNRPVAIGIFAPQREQSKTDFDRLKTALMRSGVVIQASQEATEKAKEESNARTLVLPNGSSCYVFPVTATSKPESKTLDLIIFEESQDLEDQIVKEQIWPMGSATNAPLVYVGTAGTRICHFYRLGQGEKAMKLYFEEIVQQRREVYEQTGDVRHLIYEQNVRQLIEQYGFDSDEIQRPYFGKWLIGTGQFTTQEELEQLMDDRKPTYHDKQSDCYAGIDTAKHPDSTVVTILRYNKERKTKELINWLELRGDNYKDQFDYIHAFLKNYKIQAIAIDSTGQGDFMPDMFERETAWTDEDTGLYRVKFSKVSKDIIYKNLKVSIKELLTRLPKLDTKIGGKFKQQLLDLQQEYKGQLLSVHHPDDPNAHDDYPDSWALAEYAYAKFTEENDVDIHILEPFKKERQVVKQDGVVTDYWPQNQDDWE